MRTPRLQTLRVAPATSAAPTARAARATPAAPAVFGALAVSVMALVLCAGSLWQCSSPTSPTTDLGPVQIQGLTLTLLDAGLGLRGVKVAFAPSDSTGITGFQLYRSLRADSLGLPLVSDLDADAREAVVALPDSSPPLTLYFGLRALRRLETGETWQSAEMPVDSLVILPPPRIAFPRSGDTLLGPSLSLEVAATTDQGILFRQVYWEERLDLGQSQWKLRLDTCLPRNDCVTPQFGSVHRADTVILFSEAGAVVKTLLCVLGSEVFDGRLTAQRQSMACTRFYRKLP